jgi:hypothetical protein
MGLVFLVWVVVRTGRARLSRGTITIRPACALGGPRSEAGLRRARDVAADRG